VLSLAIPPSEASNVGSEAHTIASIDPGFLTHSLSTCPVPPIFAEVKVIAVSQSVEQN
jgi:hypothetical protein